MTQNKVETERANLHFQNPKWWFKITFWNFSRVHTLFFIKHHNTGKPHSPECLGLLFYQLQEGEELVIRNLSTAGLTIIASSKINWIEHSNAALDLLIRVHRHDFQMQSYLASV